MKKIIALLALTMALCLACGVALAAIDYTKPVYNSTNTQIFFEDTTTHEYVPFNFTMDKLTYPTVNLALLGDTAKYKVVDSKDCATDNWIEVYPTNAESLRTRNPEDKTNKPALKTDVGDGYFGYSAAMQVNKKVTATEIKALIKATGDAADVLYNNLKAKPHTYTDKNIIVKEASCTEEGEIIPICDVCGKKGDSIITKGNNHKAILSPSTIDVLLKYGNYTTTTPKGKYFEVTKYPTCSAKGEYKGYCPDCGAKDATFELPKDPNAHEWGEWQYDTKPTCTESGLRWHICFLCKKTVYDVPAALGHDWEYDFEKEPTCMADGQAVAATCTVCGLVLRNTDADTELTKAGLTKVGGFIKVEADPTAHPQKNWTKLAVGTELEGKKATKPTCTVAGLDVYKCTLCGKVANAAVIPATGHKLETVYRKASDKSEVKSVTCADQKEVYQSATICKGNCDKTTDKVYYAHTFATVAETDWKEVATPAHTWGAWTMVTAPSDKTLGLWYRECQVCHVHEDYQGAVAPTNADDPTKPTKNGLQLEEDGTFQLYVDGQKSNANGIFAYDGQQFVVTGGKLDKVNGAQLVNGEWYWVAEGRVVAEANGFVEYDGQWFVAKAGKIDTSYNGLFSYNGGKFVVAVGRLVKEYNGLWQNTDGTWYFISNGQVFDWYSGEVEYDGATFTVKDGKVA